MTLATAITVTLALGIMGLGAWLILLGAALLAFAFTDRAAPADRSVARIAAHIRTIRYNVAALWLGLVLFLAGAIVTARLLS